MVERALSFGTVAAAYERFRLGYPESLVDAVLRYAGRPVHTALEIGAGTGKATRAFAARGIVVTATDPDPAMLAELARQVPPTVRPLCATFEDVASDPALDPAYDLVFAAASMHWTNPSGRWERVARMLAPGGVFASFGAPSFLADPDLERRVAAARAPFVADVEVPSPDGTPADDPMQWPGTELVASDRFTDVQQSVLERRVTMDVEEYLGHLATVSAYVVLSDDVRATAFAAIREVLPDQVVVNADLTLHLARLVGPTAPEVRV